jgi:hypothetical protein
MVILFLVWSFNIAMLFCRLEFFVDPQSGHIPGTHQSVNLSWGCAVHGQESQIESMEDVYSDCEDEAESEPDNYDDFLVRCEGDTDVEDCFPTQIQEAAVVKVRSMVEIRKEVRVKDAKYKAELTRAAKRRAIEGVVDDEDIIFSDQDSDEGQVQVKVKMEVSKLLLLLAQIVI